MRDIFRGASSLFLSYIRPLIVSKEIEEKHYMAGLSLRVVCQEIKKLQEESDLISLSYNPPQTNYVADKIAKQTLSFTLYDAITGTSVNS